MVFESKNMVTGEKIDKIERLTVSILISFDLLFDNRIKFLQLGQNLFQFGEYVVIGEWYIEYRGYP